MSTPGYTELLDQLARSEQVFQTWQRLGKPAAGRARVVALLRSLEGAKRRLEAAWRKRRAALDAAPLSTGVVEGLNEMNLEMARVLAALGEAKRGGVALN